jgi:hypothetical protein
MTQNQGLVGLHFMAKERGWQGRVVSEVSPGAYLIETYDWLLGEPYSKQVVSLGEIMNGAWEFWDTAEEMRDFYERHPDYFKPKDATVAQVLAEGE